MVVQAPISRHQSGDRTMTGMTTMIGRSSTRQKTTNLDDKMNSFFRHHALAGPRIRSMSGTLGDGEYVTAQRLGSEISSTPSRMSEGSFGTKDTKRSVTDLIKDLGSNRPRRQSGAKTVMDLVETKKAPYRNTGGKIFHKKARWNTKDNIASPKFSGYH